MVWNQNSEMYKFITEFKMALSGGKWPFRSNAGSNLIRLSGNNCKCIINKL